MTKVSSPELTERTDKNDVIDFDLKSQSGKWKTEELLKKCEEMVERFEYEAAMPFCERVLTQDEGNLQALLIKSTIQTDLGLDQEARQTLNLAISFWPDRGYEHYLALAQLSKGEESLRLYEKALLNFDSYPSENGSEDTGLASATRSTIYCAMAELYLTDLCGEDNAESVCETLVAKALELDANSYEAFMTKANLLVSQGRGEDAIGALEDSLALWTQIPIDSVAYPCYEFRLTTARLLIELGMYDLAYNLLLVLVEEDEEVLESWYLYGLVQYLIAKDSVSPDEVAPQMLSVNVALCQAEKVGLIFNVCFTFIF